MATLSDRLSKLEGTGGNDKAARWHAAMERNEQICAAASVKLSALIERNLAERGIDPDHLPPQTSGEEAQSKRELLNALKAAVRESQSV